MNLKYLSSPLLWADSYKLSHWNQIPEDVLTVHGTAKDGYWYKEHGSMAEARSEPNDLLKLRYKDGKFYNHQSFADVRKVAEEHRQWI